MSSSSGASENQFPASYYEDPSFFEFFERLYISVNEFAFNSTKYPHDYNFTKQMLLSVQLIDVLTAIGLAIGFTIMRVIITNYFSNPLSDALQLLQKNRRKWAESVWKFIYYSFVWAYCVYVVILSGKYDFFQNPLHIFKGFVFGKDYLSQPIPSDIYWIYALQLGFYLHSVYGTLFMDVWRKDSAVMLFHHGLSIFLLEFSYLMKYYKIGALVLLLHDLSDVLLEFTKLNIYLKDRGGQYYRINDWLSTVGFILFSISWAWLRLFWFPLKVLYTCHWGVYVYNKDKDPKMFVFFNLMLYALQILHIYWFYFVILLMVRVATGKASAVDDTREFENAKKDKKKRRSD